ncbi:phasin family protein [Janthinobacterium psychrotolerans]|uniref:Poly(Hydroxyalcanoate) granule associated protein (Phasin) n=1 Tax=Janthinobacterium psychrotolerans TaxID=1747903 RepID=A0A1A7C326_9BURK|nr:phasin family protein [Janthinobacterium psychrotolerans]OBV40137.1 Poly(hydroxyalcanoate) granule associated protein (phasin) [Janthinobacterium psychrotolerans]
MTKKLKHDTSGAMQASARQIWQASLGAFALAQEEGGRLLASLAHDGAALPPAAQAAMPGGAAHDRLEQVFEERVARALATIGVPTQAELAALREQVEQLQRQLAMLSAGAARAVKKVPVKKKAAPAGKQARKAA